MASKKLQSTLPRSSLLIIYKPFISFRLDYDEASYYTLFYQRIRSLQYNVALEVTGAITVSSREKLDQAIGLEFLQHKCYSRKRCYSFKTFKSGFPNYLTSIISISNRSYHKRRYESLQKRTALAITGIITSSSREKNQSIIRLGSPSTERLVSETLLIFLRADHQIILLLLLVHQIDFTIKDVPNVF